MSILAFWTDRSRMSTKEDEKRTSLKDGFRQKSKKCKSRKDSTRDI